MGKYLFKKSLLLPFLFFVKNYFFPLNLNMLAQSEDFIFIVLYPGFGEINNFKEEINELLG